MFHMVPNSGKPLEKISQNIEECRKCPLWNGAIHAVPGEGPSNARAILIGQNPGSEEDKTGKPFVGRSGRYLNNVLLKYGIERRDLFITGVVKHVTPKNRKPKSDEIKACLPYLIDQIGIIKPKIIVLMGGVAHSVPRTEGIIYVETCHPAAAMRFPKMMQQFEGDMAKFKELFYNCPHQ